MNNKFSVNLSFDIVCEKDTEKLTADLHKLIKDFSEGKYLFINQVSVQQFRNYLSSDPLKVNDDGSPYVEKFEIKNVVTGIL